MAKAKKGNSKQKPEDISNNDKILEIKTYEDFNEEKPLSSDPNLKESNVKNKNKGVIKMYTCSMHPEVITEKPGKCPKCGMELIIKN